MQKRIWLPMPHCIECVWVCSSAGIGSNITLCMCVWESALCTQKIRQYIDGLSTESNLRCRWCWPMFISNTFGVFVRVCLCVSTCRWTERRAKCAFALVLWLFSFLFLHVYHFSSSPTVYPVPCAEYNAIGALFVWHSKYSLLSNRIIFSVRCHLHAALRCNVHVCRHCAFMFRQFTHKHTQTYFKKKMSAATAFHRFLVSPSDAQRH